MSSFPFCLLVWIVYGTKKKKKVFGVVVVGCCGRCCTARNEAGELRYRETDVRALIDRVIVG